MAQMGIGGAVSAPPAVPPRVLAIVGPVCLAGIATVVAASVGFPPVSHPAGDVAAIAGLLAGMIIAERFPVPVEGVDAGGVTLGFVFSVAAIVLFGWRAGVIVAAGGPTVAQLIGRRPPLRVAYNGSMFALSALAGGLAGEPFRGSSIGTVLARVAICAFLYNCTNLVLISAVLAADSKRSFFKLIWSNARRTTAAFALMSSAALMLVVLWQRSPAYSIALVGPLLAIALYQRSTFAALRAMRLALTDPLTGLGNHRHFHERLQRELARAEQEGAALSLCLVDIDDFKRVNDRFGHPRGDSVLRQVAQILGATTREADYAARYGGEEFAILLPKTSPADARLLADRIRARVRDIVVEPGDGFRISASIGVADFPVCGLDAKTMLGAADTALLWAKRRGRNCVLYYRDVREMMAALPTDDADERSWRNGIEVLAAAVDAKASYREHHGDAVAEMVRELAERAGLPEADREIYGVAARLHDDGKVGIRAELLEKGDRLTDDDRRELRRHVDLGVDIFTNAEAPREFIEIVRHHHERWDGRGYPDGLRGDEIPMGARLIAIGDSFQAMLSDRPYRAALTLDQARAEIRRGAGVQFDPVLARLFLDACRTSGAAGVAPEVPAPGTAGAAPQAPEAGASGIAATETPDAVDGELPTPKRTADD